MNEKTVVSAGSKAAADVAALLRARNPLLWIVSREEERVEHKLALETAPAAKYPTLFWDCATGVTKFGGESTEGGERLKDAGTVLDHIRDSKARGVWVLRDFHKFLPDPFVLRAMRSLARSLPTAPLDEARALVVLSPSSDVPPELAGHAIVVEWPLPDRSEISEILDGSISVMPEELREAAAPNGTREAAIDAALGLSSEEAKACYSKSLVSTRKIDPVAVAAEKKKIVAREGLLEWYEPLAGGLDVIGGLDVLKTRLKRWALAFGPRARAYGLDTPKGMLLMGVPGCGKSLTAKAVAAAWGRPLLKMDMGALKGSLVGESEAKIRGALKLADMVGGILWVDEIEKALAGATQGAHDGGVSADALGTLLTWMQDRKSNVFVVATANDVSSLASASNGALLRKGRFDEIFFVDLPNGVERAAIIKSALKMRGRALTEDALGRLSALTAGFTGAELDALVPEAMFAAFDDGEREVGEADLAAAATATVPLSKTSAESIEALRKWAKGRATPASTPEAVKSGATGRKLDIA